LKEPSKLNHYNEILAVMTIEYSDTFIELPCELELGNDDDPATGKILLTEGGELSIQFEKGTVRHSNLRQSWKEINGYDNRGRSISVNRATATGAKNHSLTKISPLSATISQNIDFPAGKDVEVAIEFDILCFLPQIPPQNQIDSTTKKSLQKLAEKESKSVDVSDKKINYIKNDHFDAYGIPLTDTTDRRDAIKHHEKPIRTAKIRIEQNIDGDLAHQAGIAEEIVIKISELSQLVQEVTPRHIRMKVVSIDDTPIEELDTYFEVLHSGRTANVGAGFSQYPKKVLWGDFHDYINQSYDNYTNRVREELRLQQVLGYYIDARDPDRAVEGKMLSVCSAIELFALWHAREDGISEKTASKIENLINKLGVETTDLAKQVVPDLNDLDTPEYFWRRERNYVVHGDPDVSTQDVIDSFEATLVLLKRIIRNQLLGQENSAFEDFYSIGLRGSIEFDD
jgi:hypothetical protein